MDIKDRISKILALAESPNENEARAALLKARELMAKYKLQPEDLEKKKGSKVVRKLTGLTCTQMTDSWMLTLSALIALKRFTATRWIAFSSRLPRRLPSTLPLLARRLGN